MKLASGAEQSGVVVGNVTNKYASGNPMVRWIMAGFHDALEGFVAAAAPTNIHEVGCGEGYWVLRWAEQGLAARGSDFSSLVIDMARENARTRGISEDRFGVRSIYELNGEDRADLIVCCEVLEHLENPNAALVALREVVGRHLIVSVPREPLWRFLNMARGRYLADLGNTPGHVQHWSRRSFVELVGRHFDIVAVRSPLPWTMLLCRQRPPEV